MDDKEKYRQALEKAKRLYEQGTITESLAYIFPELAESEDERIRKRLLTDFSVLGREEWGGLKVKDICAWLEKQKYTQRDVDDAYLKGVTDTKNELEKQGELPEGCVRKQVAEAKEALYSAPCVDTINGQGITNQVSQSEVTKISDKGWSEEDENELYIVISTIESRAMISQLEQYRDILYKSIDWLQSIKQRLGGK